ncbi:MAG: class E sortase [Mycobacteriales bacterium]|nr:class E sortase [Frankia sp.]
MEPSFAPPPTPQHPRPARKLLGDSLRRPGGRRALSVLSLVLALAGVGMFAYPFATDLYSSRLQQRLRDRFDDPDFKEAYRLRQIGVGEGLTRLRIPKFGLSVLVVEGTTTAALKAGAGHYLDTPLPCEAGNVGIAGHRTTYGRPFNRLGEMKPGDEVFLDTPFETCRYVAAVSFDGLPNPHPVRPNDFHVVARPPTAGEHWLTLTTCHPKGSAKQRLVLRLTLAEVLPLQRG